jgi:hypothetical protein
MTGPSGVKRTILERLRKVSLWVGVGFIFFGARADVAHASSEIQFIYDLNFEVDQLVMFAYGPHASGAEQISISYLFSSIGPGVGSLTTSTPPFLPIVLETFLMGISTLGGSDEHLVIFTNDGFANNVVAESLDFGTLFTAVPPSGVV